jgi:hypothetical protein
MRLIDADMLIEEIEKIALEVEQQTQSRRNGKTLAQGILFGFGAMRKTVLEQPTAYDVDKVAAQLERDKFIDIETTLSDVHQGYNAGISRAIEIVKGGGVDGN